MEFDEVYRDTVKYIFSYLYSLCGEYHLAEDLTQETFYKAYLNLEKFNGNCKLETWLSRIAKNLFTDYLRKNMREKTTELTEEVPVMENMLDQLAGAENMKQIYKIILELEEPYQEIFLLRYNEELSLKEISALYGKSESWARVMYYRARIRIQEKIREGKLYE